jgi:hypothetical protein
MDIPLTKSRGRKTPRDDVRERISPQYKIFIPYHVRDMTVYMLRIYNGKRAHIDYTSLAVPCLV